MLLPLALTVALSFADSVETYYAHKNTDALVQLCSSAERREAGLLCRYRLYPLTRSDHYLENLPEDLSGGSAREYALLGGLWGYQAAQAPLIHAIRFGRRSDRLLEKARELNASDPFVLLIDGQSLLFRPRIAGGDPRAALERFRRLELAVERAPGCGISRMEADLWRWYAMSRTGSEEASALRRELLRHNPPTLYREFLRSTHRVR